MHKIVLWVASRPWYYLGTAIPQILWYNCTVPNNK